MASGTQLAVAPKREMTLAEKKQQELVDMISDLQPEMARALPKHLTADRMARIVITTLRQDSMKSKGLKIVECDKWSFAGAVMTAASLGLEVNTPLGHAYLIPRKIDGVNTCTLQIGYQGLLQLARNSGRIDSIWGHAVYEGDHFVRRLGLENTFEHEPNGEEDPKKLTHVYACAKIKDVRDPVFVILTRKQVDAARARGGDRSFSPWQTDYVAMAQKTALRRLCKWLPLSLELARAVQIDEIDDRGRRQVRAFAAELPELGDALEHRGLLIDSEPADDGESEEVAEAGSKAAKARDLEAEARGTKPVAQPPKSSPSNGKPTRQPDPEPDALQSQAARESILDRIEAATTVEQLVKLGTEAGKAALIQHDRDILNAAYKTRLEAIKNPPPPEVDDDVADLLGPTGRMREPGEEG